MAEVKLRDKISDHGAKIGVIGLGYVGLPVAALFAEKGYDVIGVDSKADRVEMINQGISPIDGQEPGLSELVHEVVEETTDPRRPNSRCLRLQIQHLSEQA